MSTVGGVDAFGVVGVVAREFELCEVESAPWIGGGECAGPAVGAVDVHVVVDGPDVA